MTTYSIKAQVREKLGKKNDSLRKQGLIPAVLYGHGIKNQNLSIKENDFLKIYGQIGTSSLVDLSINEARPVKTLIHDLQRDPQTDNIIHVDFYQIKEDEKIKTEMLLEFIGEAPAVKELGGILVKNYDEIEIECLPKDLELINKIQVDLSQLANFNDAVHIKDLKVPSQIKILEDLEEAVVFISEPQEEKVEEVKPIEAVEGITKEGEVAGEAAPAEKGKAEILGEKGQAEKTKTGK